MRIYTCLFAVAASLAMMPALAQAADNTPQFATTTATVPVNTATNSVAKSNADNKLSEMPLPGLQPTGQILDADGDGIPDAQDKNIGIPNPFAPQETKDTGPKKKQVYKGTPLMQMPRAIKDDRIDDGYVQGLMQHNAPR